MIAAVELEKAFLSSQGLRAGPPPARRSSIVSHLAEVFAIARELQLEGLVGKRADSIYVPGEVTADWVKLKVPGAVPPERFRL